MNDKEKIIRDLIKKESLRIIKESQAFFLIENYNDIENVIEDIGVSIIDVNEKRLDKLKSEEESAKEKEDFSELKRIKIDQLSVVDKLIRGYSKKVELFQKIKEELTEEMINIQKNGAGVFKNQEIPEFNNEKFEKDWGLKIQTPNFFIDLIKIMDNNAYKVVNTNVKGLDANDLLQIPNLKLGGGGKIQVFRDIGGRYENVTNFNIQNITRMVKNPQ